MSGQPHGHRRSMAGAATLLVTVVLLGVSTLLALYLGRSLVFEQRTAANQVRATTAQAAAEAGLAWAVAMLNHPEGLNGQCRHEAGAPPFRQRYRPSATGAPAAGPGCAWAGSAGDAELACACPSAGQAALGTTADAGFSASISAEPQASTEAWRIAAMGCAAPQGGCSPGTAWLADATATASVNVVRQPLLRTAPLATLTCGGRCELAGTVTLTNRSAAAQGLLVQAGAAIAIGSDVVLQSLPGTPGGSALAPQDGTLHRGRTPDPDCSQGTLFDTYAGAPLSTFARAPTVLVLDCNQTTDCGGALMQAYDRGWRAFHLPAGFAGAGSAGPLQLGQAPDPVLLVASGPLHLPEGSRIHGLVFVNHPGQDAFRASSGEIRGAVVACGNLRLDGNSRLHHDRAVLDAVRLAGSLWVPVPGSWKDFE